MSTSSLFLNEENVNQDYCFDYITDDKVEDFVQEFPLDHVNLYQHVTGRRSPDYLKEQANFETDGLVGEADWDHLSGIQTTSATGHLAQVEETRIPDKLWKTLYHGIRAAHNRGRFLLSSSGRSTPARVALPLLCDSLASRLGSSLCLIGTSRRPRT